MLQTFDAWRGQTMNEGSRRVVAPRRVAQAARTCIAVLALLPLPALAHDVQIARTDCAQPLHLVAKGAPLSMVLKDLSERLHFVVVYQSQTDPLVSTDVQAYATDLVRKLARDMNFSLEEASDPRCAQGRRIAKLSILADPASGNRATVASTRPAWQTPEMERIARLGMQDYLQSHGIADQSMEELAVH
jgi:hypothetical protein